MDPYISPVELLALLATPDAPRIIDVCTPQDHALGPRLIPGARQVAHGDVRQLPGRTVIVCQKGLKLSLGAAARLCAQGHAAVALEGGMVGWAAAGLPLVSAGDLPASGLWVAPAGPEALILHWLVGRCLPPGHSLLIVPPEHVAPVAEKFDATALADPAAFFATTGLDWPEATEAVALMGTSPALLAQASRDEALLLGDLALKAARARAA